MVNLAIENKVEKILYVSSVAAIGLKNGKTIINGYQMTNQPHFHSYYGVSKHIAEIEVWRASQEGIHVQIVYPGVVLRSLFFNRSSGKWIPQVKKSTGFIQKEMISSTI